MAENGKYEKRSKLNSGYNMMHYIVICNHQAHYPGNNGLKWTSLGIFFFCVF